MIKNFFLLTFITALFCLNINAQEATIPVEELKKTKAEKEAQIKALQGEVDGLASKIATYPGWKYGGLGIIGFNASQFNNWLGRGIGADDTYSGILNLGLSGFANLDQDKYFWRNDATLNVAWTKVANNTVERDSIKLFDNETADAFNLKSLFGYKLAPKWAVSILGEYRTTVLSNFNNPGYIDIGAGVTWLPIPNMVVVFHPLNYHAVLSSGDISDFQSALGCKIVADYARALPMGIAWKSNLSAFLSYKDSGNLSDWTWVNGFSFTAWKGIGVGIEFGLRGSRQESYNVARQAIDLAGLPISDDFKIDNFDEGGLFDNPLQSYWTIGLTYRL